MTTIPILVSAPGELDDDTKGIFTPDADVIFKELPVDIVKENLSQLSASVTQLLSDVKKVGNFRLSEVTLQVEISAEGGVTLIGTAKIAGKGAITLKFVE